VKLHSTSTNSRLQLGLALNSSKMAENGDGQQTGVPLTGATFDQELYGGVDRYAGFDTSIGLNVDEDQDERERALAR